MTHFPNRDDERASSDLNDALGVLLRFGAAMLNAGDTAFRVREWMSVMARTMGFDVLSVSLTHECIAATARRGREQATLVHEIGPPGVNAWRIGALEQLAKTVTPDLAPHKIAAKLAEVEAALPRYSVAQTAGAIGVACGAFAFLNGGAALEVIASGIGGGIGQWVRSTLSRWRLNQYGVTAVSAVVASGVYVLVAVMLSHAGFGISRHTPGFISSILFLVPGFPLVAALFDLLQHQTVVAVTRFAYAVMLLLAATFGASIVIAVVGFDAVPQPPFKLSYPFELLWRAIASFAGGCGFAILYNSSTRAVLLAGFLALGANELRLALHDAGMMLAPATFFGALAVGLVATMARPYLNEPRITITVPGVIIMVPGLYAFQMIAQFNQGHMLDALQAAASCGFIIGAMAMGLATARFLFQVR